MGKLSTYTICIDGQYYAVGANLFMDKITSLETGRTRSGIRTAEDRDRAILGLASPSSWREAIALARSAGNYIGELIPTDNAHTWPEFSSGAC